MGRAAVTANTASMMTLYIVYFLRETRFILWLRLILTFIGMRYPLGSLPCVT